MACDRDEILSALGLQQIPPQPEITFESNEIKHAKIQVPSALNLERVTEYARQLEQNQVKVFQCRYVELGQTFAKIHDTQPEDRWLVEQDDVLGQALDSLLEHQSALSSSKWLSIVQQNWHELKNSFYQYFQSHHFSPASQEMLSQDKPTQDSFEKNTNVKAGCNRSAWWQMVDDQMSFPEIWLEQYQVGVTWAQAGLCQTGSIVLRTAAQRPRILSLAMPVHLAIIPATQLYLDFADYIHHQQSDVAGFSNQVVITGPSKTADIQQTLAYGAHGPCQLWVLILLP